jgi:hypothetical protein
MAHGTPDWGVTAGSATVYQLNDMAELAARLGSPITHDRRGDVVWWDDYEWSFNKWLEDLSGTGAATAISTVTARNGRCSGLLTAGSTASAFASREHNGPFPALSVMGFEISFCVPDAFGEFEAAMDLYDGAEVNNVAIKVDDVNSRLEYLDSAGVYQVLASGVDVAKEEGFFHTLKIVYDLASGKYARVILDSETYLMTGVAGLQQASASRPAASLVTRIWGHGGLNDLCYVDDAILTQNEPV